MTFQNSMNTLHPFVRWAGIGLWLIFASVLIVNLSEIFTAMISSVENAGWISAAIFDSLNAFLWVMGTYIIAPTHKFNTATVVLILGLILSSRITFFLIPQSVAGDITIRYIPYVLSTIVGIGTLVYLKRKQSQG